MEQPRVKITQKDFDEMYEIDTLETDDKKGITGETEASPETRTTPDIPNEQDTTPEFLTEEEEQHDKTLEETISWEPETK